MLLEIILNTRAKLQEKKKKLDIYYESILLI